MSAGSSVVKIMGALFAAIAIIATFSLGVIVGTIAGPSHDPECAMVEYSARYIELCPNGPDTLAYAR